MDRILVQVANRLRSAFRETDTVARFGGDEFVAVVPEHKRCP
ncbi:MAG: diguanylate cyclase [Aquificota bacterium]|nr:diguanylate cyclase [Aquificota bacterium]